MGRPKMDAAVAEPCGFGRAGAFFTFSFFFVVTTR
jgi:hypothetical protein